jgi:hypothetical protein
MRRAVSLASFVKFDITAPSYSRAKGYDGNWSESKHLPQKKRCDYARTIEPARALAAETLTLERALSDLLNQAHSLTAAEIDLMWNTGPPRMPIPSPAN